MIPSSHDWRVRAQALLQAPRDVVPPVQVLQVAAEMGSPKHRDLFREYVSELRRVKKWAEDWWQALLRAEESRIGDPGLALQNVRGRWPVGPAATQRVVAVIRRFWLACATLNEQNRNAGQVAPEVLLLQWLMGEGHDDLAEFLSRIPFWPVGLDPDGRWI